MSGVQAPFDPDRRIYRSAWLAALAGPVAWATALEVLYALTPHACGAGRGWLHLTTVAGLIAAGFGGLVAWLNRVTLGRASRAGDEGSPAAQIQFLSTIGLMTNALFGLVLVAQWLAIFLLDPCSSS